MANNIICCHSNEVSCDRSGGQAEFFPLLERALADRAWIPKPTAAKATIILNITLINLVIHSFIESVRLFENSSLNTVLTHAVIGSCEEGDEGRNHRNPEEHVQEEQGRPGQHL